MKKILLMVIVMALVFSCIAIPSIAKEDDSTAYSQLSRVNGEQSMPKEEAQGLQTEEAESQPEGEEGILPESYENMASQPALPIETENMQNDNSEEKEITHQPRIMLTGSLPENVLKAGSAVYWNVTVKNCSKTEVIENMKVTLTTDRQDISLEKTSWYFDSISPGKTVDLSQNITALKKALAETAIIQFQFEYEDKQGNGYTCTESVSLSVVQEQQGEIVNLAFPDIVYSSDTNPCTFQVYNSGLSTLYNVKVSLKGRGLFPTKDMFFGNLEEGDSQEGEIPVFTGTLDMEENGEETGVGEKYGNTVATVLFSYENENGEVIEREQQINVEIKKPKQVNLKIENEVKKTNQWWISIIIIAFIVLIFVIAWLYIGMRRYKRLVAVYEKA